MESGVGHCERAEDPLVEEAIERYAADHFTEVADQVGRDAVNPARAGINLKRQLASVERQRRQEGRAIPPGFAFAGIPGLSREMVERLTAVRPPTLGHAARIPGVTAAAVAVVSAYLDRSPGRARV